jgi:hypothetical protein
MPSLLEMVEGVCTVISSAADVAAYQATPDVCFCMANTAFCGRVRVEEIVGSLPAIVLRVSTYGTTLPFPRLQTDAVEHVLTYDRQ